MRGRKISGVCELGAGLSVGDIFADCDWRVGLGCLAGYKVTKRNKLCYKIDSNRYNRFKRKERRELHYRRVVRPASAMAPSVISSHYAEAAY